MKYLVKSAIKGPKGPAMPGEVVELDEKLATAMLAAGLIELVGAPKVQEPMEEVKPQVMDQEPQPKKKKGK